MNQLERDLRRQVRRKLELWVQDSFELYEMGEVSPMVAGASILEALMRVTSTMVAGLSTLPAHEAAAVMYDLIERKRADIAKQEQAEK